MSRDSLQTVISWTLRDLESWANNEQATERVQGFSAMLLEAVRYQMQKEIDKLNKQEEQ